MSMHVYETSVVILIKIFLTVTYEKIPLCSCLKGNEIAEHYIFSCEHYTEQRVRLFRNTREFHLLNVNMLLDKKYSLYDSDNAKLFRHVQNHIHATGIFTR